MKMNKYQSIILGFIINLVLLSRGFIAPLLAGFVVGYFQKANHIKSTKVSSMTGIVSVIILTPVFLAANLPIRPPDLVSLELWSTVTGVIVSFTIGGYFGSVFERIYNGSEKT